MSSGSDVSCDTPRMQAAPPLSAARLPLIDDCLQAQSLSQATEIDREQHAYICLHDQTAPYQKWTVAPFAEPPVGADQGVVLFDGEHIEKGELSEWPYI